MKEKDIQKISVAVDRYIAYLGNPPEPSNENVLWRTAWPVRYYIEARERWDNRSGGHLSRIFINLYKHWQLSQLLHSSMYDGSRDAEFKNVVGLNGLRFLRTIYPDLPLDPSVNDELDRLNSIFPENPLQELLEKGLVEELNKS